MSPDPNRRGNQLREIIFNYMTKEWTSVRSNSHDILHIYDFVKDLKQKAIEKAAYRTKDLVKLHWFELCSLAVLNNTDDSRNTPQRLCYRYQCLGLCDFLLCNGYAETLVVVATLCIGI